MPRSARDRAPGVFHVTTHGLWAAPGYFRDDDDRLTFLRELARAKVRCEWRCLAFCLLGTHYHLLLDVGTDVLSRGMQMLNWRYAVRFNQRHGLRGHAQGARFYARRVEDDADLLTVFRYVARNPVEAELCETPQDWPWSSYAATVGLAEPSSLVEPALVLACLDTVLERAVPQLRLHVEEP